VALSDRDNVETNVTWTFWPEGAMMGLSVDEIVPFLKVLFAIEHSSFRFRTQQCSTRLQKVLNGSEIVCGTMLTNAVSVSLCLGEAIWCARVIFRSNIEGVYRKPSMPTGE